MRHWISDFCALALMVGLAACGDTTNVTNNNYGTDTGATPELTKRGCNNNATTDGSTPPVTGHRVGEAVFATRTITQAEVDNGSYINESGLLLPIEVPDFTAALPVPYAQVAAVLTLDDSSNPGVGATQSPPSELGGGWLKVVADRIIGTAYRTSIGVMGGCLQVSDTSPDNAGLDYAIGGETWMQTGDNPVHDWTFTTELQFSTADALTYAEPVPGFRLYYTVAAVDELRTINGVLQSVPVIQRVLIVWGSFTTSRASARPSLKRPL